MHYFCSRVLILSDVNISSTVRKLNSLASLPAGCLGHCTAHVVLKYFLSSLCPFTGLWAPETWAWLQPEELTLLLIQLRRHQANLAGVHSPSDAFAQLQNHQHNGLLGPNMQVRGPCTSLNVPYSSLQPLPVHCGLLSPSHSHTLPSCHS